MREIIIKFLKSLILKIEKLIDILHSSELKRKRSEVTSVWFKDIDLQPLYLFYIIGAILVIQNIFVINDIVYFFALSSIVVVLFAFWCYSISNIFREVISSFSSTLLILTMLLLNIYFTIISESYGWTALFVSTTVTLVVSLIYLRSVAVLFAVFAVLISSMYLPSQRLFYLSGNVLSAFIAILLSQKINTRGGAIVAGVKISVVNILIVALLKQVYNIQLDRVDIFIASLSGIISAFAILFILPLIETIFGVLSQISLVEMSDINKPLLKQMMIDAPGTYHHSMVTASLSEAACDAIGASGQLARVGAYYHDIGKLYKPEYFIENQIFMSNPHDTINPSISSMVLMAHVKEGVELARKKKINRKIIEFIQEHHGTSLLVQFYHKAITKNVEVDEMNYRYDGIKPRSKETAVVMLADSVEAASRGITSLKLSAISEMVKKVINNKFVDGQLSDSPLTLKDIEKVSEVMTRVLCGVLHVRYQQQKVSS